MARPLLPDLPRAVTLREVGPRDGLQGEAPLPPVVRAVLAASLVEAGARRIEAASFVSERAVPAMAGGAEVIRQLEALGGRRPGVVVAALVPNLTGALFALDCGVDELTVTVAASAAYNERNVRRTIDESVEEIGLIVARAAEQGVAVDAVVSCAFGSPYEGEIPPPEVARLCGRLVALGAGAVTLADTTGVATPEVLAGVVGALDAAGLGLEPGLHLHETRGTALVNAYAALALGLTRFDTSIAGLGGSPFAAGAGGSLSTEDFVSFLGALGIENGYDLHALVEIAAGLAERLGREPASKVRAANVKATGR